MKWNSSKQQTPEEDTWIIDELGLCWVLESYWPPIMAVKSATTGHLIFLETDRIKLIIKRKN